MRKIALTLVAVLAMTGVTFAVTIDYVQNADPAEGLRSFTVQATGIDINTLSQFTIDGEVYQMWVWGAPSEWLYDGSASGDPKDSYVIFGGMRIADMPMHTGGVPGSQITLETLPGGGDEGLGTLNNYDSGTPTWDGYLYLGTPTETEATVDLMQLVIPDGKAVTVSLSLVTIADDGSGDPYPFVDTTVHGFGDFGTGDALVVKSPLDGDANVDGIVDLVDLGRVGLNWEQAGSWTEGDFNGDGIVDLVDLGRLGLNWEKTADWYEAGEGSPIPEPSTLILLVLGGLCLVGYRLRK